MEIRCIPAPVSVNGWSSLQLPEIALESPAATGLGTATRGFFLKSILVRPSKHVWLCVLLFVFIAIVGTTAHAVNNYYVSPSGSGSACTQANPCGSIAQAHSTLTVGSAGSCVAGGGWLTVPNAGACVHVLPGTYNGSISISKSGASSAKIVYISENKWGAKLVNPQWSQSGSNTEIDGFDMTGPGVAYAVLLSAGSNRSIQYNYIHDISNNSCGLNGVIHETTAPSSGDTINGNVIRHFGNAGVCAGGAGFHGIYADGSGLKITNNIISGGSGGWAIQKQYAGITDCTPGIISNNTIFNNAGGIVLNDEGNSCKIDHWTITNNIIVNNGISGTGGGGGSSFGIDYWNFSAGNTLVSNNLVYGNLPANFGNHGSACSPGAGNCPATNLKSDASPSVTFVNFQSDTNAAPASNYNVDNYQIQSGSSAFQNGTTNCAPSGLSPCVATLDIVGSARLSLGSTLNIGAYEQNGAVGSVPSAPTGLTAQVQ
jgi:hypothetical protein